MAALMRADAAKCAMISIWPEAFAGAAVAPGVVVGASPSNGDEAGNVAGADDLAATRAAMTAWACGDREDGAGAAPPAAVPAAAPAPPRALRMARACGFGGGACAELSIWPDAVAGAAVAPGVVA